MFENFSFGTRRRWDRNDHYLRSRHVLTVVKMNKRRTWVALCKEKSSEWTGEELTNRKNERQETLCSSKDCIIRTADWTYNTKVTKTKRMKEANTGTSIAESTQLPLLFLRFPSKQRKLREEGEQRWLKHVNPKELGEQYSNLNSFFVTLFLVVSFETQGYTVIHTCSVKYRNIRRRHKRDTRETRERQKGHFYCFAFLFSCFLFKNFVRHSIPESKLWKDER